MTGPWLSGPAVAGGWARVGWPDPAPGNREEIDRLASACRGQSDLADQTYTGLTKVAGGDGVWEGQAALAFQSRLGDLLPHLGRLRTSYGRAAEVLGVYAGTLPELQLRAAHLLPRVIEADRLRMEADPFSSQSFSVLGGSAFAEAAQDLAALRREHEAIAEQHRAAVDRCRAGLDEAAELGMRNDGWSYLRRHLRSTAKTVDTWSGGIGSGATLLGIGAAAVFPPAAPVLAVVALGAGAVSVAAKSAVVASDVAYGGPVAEESAWLALDVAFLGKSAALRPMKGAAKATAERSAARVSDAEREYDAALAAKRQEVVADLAKRRPVVDEQARIDLTRQRTLEVYDDATDVSKIEMDKARDQHDKAEEKAAEKTARNGARP